MENGMNYLWFHQQNNMQGGDGLYGRMAFAQYHYQGLRDAIDPDLEHKTKKVADKMSENFNIIANEPSLAFFRIQEHVRKTLPQLVETKHEVQEVHQKVQGACFDTEYATNAVKSMHASGMHFQNIQDLLKNAMFMKQQIEYEDSRNSTSLNGDGGAVRGAVTVGAVGSGDAIVPGQAAHVDEGVEAEEEELVAAFAQQPADRQRSSVAPAALRPVPIHAAPKQPFSLLPPTAAPAPPTGQEPSHAPPQGEELVGSSQVSMEASSEPSRDDSGAHKPSVDHSGTEQPESDQPDLDLSPKGLDKVTEPAAKHPDLLMHSGESPDGQPSDQEMQS